jgi:alpha-L-arabinofuranosidase
MIDSKKAGRNIDLAITEWGILGNLDGPHVINLGGAVYAGLFYNMVIRLKEYIRVTNATAIFHGGCIQKAGPFIYADPQVEVIRRYSQLAGGSLIPVSYEGPGYDVEMGIFFAPHTDDVPYLDSICVCRQDGVVVLVIINRHPEQTIPLQIDVGKLKGMKLSSYEEMNGESLIDTNTPLMPDKVKFAQKSIKNSIGNLLHLDIRAHSITWLEFIKDEK